MSVPGLRPERAGRRAGWTLAGLALVLTGLAGAAPAPGPGTVLARLGPITVSATALRPGPAGTLTTSLQVSTGGQPSDQLDAAIAAGGTAVGGLPPAGQRRRNPGPIRLRCRDPAARRGGPLAALRAAADPGAVRRLSPPATATLTVAPGSSSPPGATLAITLYFAHAGSVLLHLPVSRA